MAKYIDLDPDRRATLVVNIAALDIAAKLLIAAAGRKITLPKNLNQDQWIKYLHQKAVERMRENEISIEDFCEAVDSHVGKSDDMITVESHTFSTNQSNLN